MGLSGCTRKAHIVCAGRIVTISHCRCTISPQHRHPEASLYRVVHAQSHHGGPTVLCGCVVQNRHRRAVIILDRHRCIVRDRQQPRLACVAHAHRKRLIILQLAICSQRDVESLTLACIPREGHCLATQGRVVPVSRRCTPITRRDIYCETTGNRLIHAQRNHRWTTVLGYAHIGNRYGRPIIIVDRQCSGITDRYRQTRQGQVAHPQGQRLITFSDCVVVQRYGHCLGLPSRSGKAHCLATDGRIIATSNRRCPITGGDIHSKASLHRVVQPQRHSRCPASHVLGHTHIVDRHRCTVIILNGDCRIIRDRDP